MSVIVKGMTLPRNCAECRLCDTCECLRDFRTYEEVLDAVEDGNLTRDQNCPLVEIPAHHGRLIDVDAIDYRNYAMHDGRGNLVVEASFISGVMWVNDCINNTRSGRRRVMVDKFLEGFGVVFIVIIITTLTITVLTIAANFIIGEIIEIKKKIEEGFWDE